jgi:hypothetical protein
MQGQEVEADRCVLDIINKDDARFNGSPISFLGMLIIGTKSSFDEDKVFARERPRPGVYRAAENRGGRTIFCDRRRHGRTIRLLRGFGLSG